MGNPRFEDDALDALAQPEEDKIYCTHCALREKDRLDGIISGATLGMCEAYSVKPEGILWGGAVCPFYTPDETS